MFLALGAGYMDMFTYWKFIYELFTYNFFHSSGCMSKVDRFIAAV